MAREVTTDSIRVSGLAAVDANLAALGSADGTRILRKAMLAAGKPILNAAKATVASFGHGSGALHKSLGMRFLYGRQKKATTFVPPMGGNFRVQILPFAKDKTAIALYNLYYKPKRKARAIRHGHLVEFGHRTKKGTVRARSFLGKSLTQQQHNAVAIFTREMEEGIARQLKRNAKKSKAAP